jgi:hypothetical protein
MKSEHRWSADEWDAFSRWGRRYLCYIQRAGVRKSIKRASHRKDRRNGRRRAQEGMDE